MQTKLTINSPSDSAAELEDWDEEQNKAPTIQEEVAEELLYHLGKHKSMEQDTTHQRIPKDLLEVLTKPFSIIYEQPWLTGVVPAEWRFSNMTLIYKKDQKDHLGNSRAVCLTSIPGNITEQVISSAIIQHTQDNPVIRTSEFLKGRSSLTNLVSFYN